MGAGTSPADRAASADGPAGEQAEDAAAGKAETEAPAADGAVDSPAEAEAPAGGAADTPAEADALADGASAAPGDGADGRTGSHPAPGPDPEPEAPAGRRSRRFPSFTRDTARPEGGGRAADRDAPAPARQWPLLAVLCTAGIGLLIVAVDGFEQAFRVGTILIGVALIGGAALRLLVPSVGMLAVRSRFTDLVTYGLLGVLIVMLSLMAQPKPWLDVPFLENAVHFTIR
ncbi:DUF3017 domain-containing protein [Streptomyces sp. NPDC091267]|uniref:DUF3017 domain-containing protein n=1 Tax=unclassified Streptomyces TaxID=2593676 RepID=UPI003421F60D